MRNSLTALTVCGSIVVLAVLLITQVPSAMGQPDRRLANVPIVNCDWRTPISSLPFTIDQCGGYFLTQCLVSEAGQSGIKINVDDVTLDLNGFTLAGVAGAIDGIRVADGVRDVTVLNGTIRGWSANGINAANARNCRFDNLRIGSSGLNGLATGISCNVNRCTLTSNGGHGVFLGQNGQVSGCVTESNTLDGIRALSNSVITDCTALTNGEDGIDTQGSVVRNCSTGGNTGDGIRGRNTSTITGNTCRGNQANGISSEGGSTISSNCCGSNTLDGITSAGSGDTIVENSCRLNGGDGIHASDRSSIVGNTCFRNTVDEIRAQSHCRIFDNTCGSDVIAGSAIHVVLDGNVMLRNHTSGKAIGLEFDAAGMVNYASENTLFGHTTPISGTVLLKAGVRENVIF